MARNSNKGKSCEMVRKIRNIDGIIDDRKRKQLKFKYGDLLTLDVHIKMHNDKINMMVFDREKAYFFQKN